MTGALMSTTGAQNDAPAAPETPTGIPQCPQAHVSLHMWSREWQVELPFSKP